MDFDAVSSCRNGMTPGVAEVGDALAHFVGRERPRLRDVLHALRREHRHARCDRGRGHALPTMQRVVGMRHAAGMHELNEDVAALVVHGISDLAPAGDMRGCVDAGRGHIALTVVGWLRALGDDQTDAGALRVIFGGKFAGNAIRVGARTRHGRHDQAIWKFKAAEADRTE